LLAIQVEKDGAELQQMERLARGMIDKSMAKENNKT
jgi:hypothetical protein